MAVQSVDLPQLQLLDPTNVTRSAIVGFIESVIDAIDSSMAPFKQLEERVRDVGRVICNALMTYSISSETKHVKAIADALPEVIEGTDGIKRKRKRIRERTISTLFGDVAVSRAIFESPYIDALTLKPFDAALSLPLHSYSPGITREVCFHVVQNAFQASVNDIKRETGVNIPVKQVQDILARAAVDVDDYFADVKPTGVSNARGEKTTIVCLEFDHKAIPMVTSDLKGKTKERAKVSLKERNKAGLLRQKDKGPRKDYKRSATVSVSYLLEKKVRTLEDILPKIAVKSIDSVAHPSKTPEQLDSSGTGDELKKRKKKMVGSPLIEPGRLRPRHKRTIASLVKSTSEVVRQCFSQGRMLDPHYERTWVALCDGERALQDSIIKEAQRRKTKMTLILDAFHASEYLWDISRSLHPEEQKAERREWVRERLEMLFKGRVRSVITDLKTIQTSVRKNSASYKLIGKTVTYFNRNKDKMQYDQYIKNGFPIASGVAEGACRHIIGDRLDKTGSRWTKEGAEDMLALRCVWASGELDRYLAYHEQLEFDENYKKVIRFPEQLLHAIDLCREGSGTSFWEDLRRFMAGKPGLSSYEV